jgi:hypothetical protein
MEIERSVQQWRLGSSHLKWGAVFGGLFVGLAIQMILTLLGLAIGAWSIDLGGTGGTRGIPTGTAIWTAISMLIAAFSGGYVAARLSGTSFRAEGIWHAMVLWGLTWVVFAWLATTAMSYLIGGLFNAFGSGLQALGQGVGSAVSQVAEKTNLNIDTNQLRRQIESVLAATGKQELQPKELRKDVGQVTEKAQKGQSLQEASDSALAEIQSRLAALDREAAINVMVNKLGMSRTQAEEVAQSAIGMIGPIKERAQALKEQSIDVANTTIQRMGSAAWWLFILGLLSMGATIAGGAVGASMGPMMDVEERGEVRQSRVTA